MQKEQVSGTRLCGQRPVVGSTRMSASRCFIVSGLRGLGAGAVAGVDAAAAGFAFDFAAAGFFATAFFAGFAFVAFFAAFALAFFAISPP